MTVTTKPGLERALQAGDISPLYLLTGIECFLRNATAEAITDAALSDTLIREFNQASFSLLTQTTQDAVAAAEQLPMMSSRRVIRICDFGKLREADEDALIGYLNRPCPSSVVIFVTDEPDKRKKLTKALLDNCVVVDFPPISVGEAKAWIKNRLKELKVESDDKALTELIDLVGTDVQTLHSELDKLSSAAGETRRITLELVEELTGRTRELSNFDLADQILARNRKRAMEVLHRLLDGGSPPVMLIGLIASNFHRLALAKEALNRGSRDEVFRLFYVPSSKRNSLMNTIQQLDTRRIAHGIDLIAAADLAIKTSQATPRLQLEMLVCELAS
jgi:DNA polymerase-3 subunit delta